MLKHYSIKLRLLVATSAMLLSQIAVAEEPKELAGYEKGFYVNAADDSYALRVNGRLQTRAQYDYEGSKHNGSLSIPNARLQFQGHAFDKRYGYGIQLAMDRGNFSLQDFFVNLGLLPHDIQLKIGHFLDVYSALETPGGANLEFADRSITYKQFKLGTVTGLLLHNGRKDTINWDVGVYENGISKISNKRLGAAAASVAYNYNGIDETTETDFEGGPFRALVRLGAFTRSQIDDWNLVGYSGSLGTMTKFFNTSANAGLFLGVPEAPRAPDSTGDKVTQTLAKDQLELGAYGQLGHVFQQRYGLAGRYAVNTGIQKGPTTHEFMASTSLYIIGHSLKLQLDGGTTLNRGLFTPLARAQLQVAF